MFIIYKCYDLGDNNLCYSSSSIIGIFDNYQVAFNELVNKINKLKYSFDIKDIYNDSYLLIKINSKNEIENGLCYEIIEKKNFIMNEIKSLNM
jgi:hypothetical protein